MSKSAADAKVADFWDYESKDWGDKYGRKTSYFYRRRTFHAYFQKTGVVRGSILDYGCGAGDITFPMLRAGHSVTGVDIAEGMARKAAERAAQSGLSERASYSHLSEPVMQQIAARKFDVVVCSSVLEYVEDDERLLRMFHDVLVDGGHLLVSVPDRRSIFCRLDRWMHRNQRFLKAVVPVHKLAYIDIQQRQYDIGQFVRRLEAMGFVLEQKRHNTITLQRGALMEKFSNIPGVGMLALMMFRKPGRPAR